MAAFLRFSAGKVITSTVSYPFESLVYTAELYIGLKDIPNKYPVEKGFDFALNNVQFSTVRLRPPLFGKKN